MLKISVEINNRVKTFYVLSLNQINKLRELDPELAQLVEECVQVSEQHCPLVRFYSKILIIYWLVTIYEPRKKS